MRRNERCKTENGSGKMVTVSRFYISLAILQPCVLHFFTNFNKVILRDFMYLFFLKMNEMTIQLLERTFRFGVDVLKFLSTLPYNFIYKVPTPSKFHLVNKN